MEAELLYRQCITDAKSHQEELVKVKERIISHTRKLICQGDTVLKEVGVKFVILSSFSIKTTNVRFLYSQETPTPTLPLQKRKLANTEW